MVAFVAWLKTFGIERYAVVLEQLAALFTLILLSFQCGRPRVFAQAGFMFLAVILVAGQEPDWGRTPFAKSRSPKAWYALEIPPPLLDDNIMFVMLTAEGSSSKPVARAHARRRPGIGATGPLFLFPNGTIQEAGAVINDEGYPIRFQRGNRLDAEGMLQPKVVDYTSGAAFLISRDLFLQVGGFDLAYEPSYYEDTDLCFKTRALGRKILFCPQSKVIHVEGSAANDDPRTEARRTALAELNRGKFVARWGKYLKTRRMEELAALCESLALDASPNAFPALTDPEKTAAVYTPFELTPGGGERYVLTAASVLSRRYQVTLVTPNPYSLIRLRNIGHELGVDLSRLRAMPQDLFSQQPQPDLMLTMGNHVIPPAAGRGKVNIYICQFPFRMGAEPTQEERTLLLGYDVFLSIRITLSLMCRLR